jgi:hypothetical protein
LRRDGIGTGGDRWLVLREESFPTERDEQNEREGESAQTVAYSWVPLSDCTLKVARVSSIFRVDGRA